MEYILSFNKGKKFPASQEGARCRKIKQTYYEKTPAIYSEFI